MKKITAVFLAILLAASTISCSSADKQADGSSSQNADILIYMGTQNDYPPFTFLDDDGNLTGLDNEFARELVSRLDGYSLDIQQLGWDGSFIALESGRIQFIVDQVAITPERQETYLFTIPYFTAGSAIVVKKGRTDIQTMDDLQGKRAGAHPGDSYAQILENYNASHGPDEQIEIVYTAGTTLDRLQDVAMGRVDAVLDDPIMTGVAINEVGLDIEVIGELVQTEPMGVLFANNEEGQALKALFDPIIQEMIDDGTIRALSLKWLNEDFTP
jgi:L-cystine transport system substrate-binding protein